VAEGGDPQAISRAVESQPGCVAVEGHLRPDKHPNAQDQQFTLLVAEAASSADATLIAAASRVGSDARHQSLGLAAGKLCCVVIARSFVERVPAYEGAGALERFRPALAELLANANSP
jgi:hypothetical protein